MAARNDRSVRGSSYWALPHRDQGNSVLNLLILYGLSVSTVGGPTGC